MPVMHLDNGSYWSKEQFWCSFADYGKLRIWLDLQSGIPICIVGTRLEWGVIVRVSFSNIFFNS